MEKSAFISNQNFRGRSSESLFNEKSSPFFNSVIQPKLTINQPNDEYEQEADAIAQHTIGTDNTVSQQQPFFKPVISPIQRKCAHCEEEEKQMQRKENSFNEINANASVENYINSLSGNGTTLDESSRNFFESRLNYDFSQVRLHTDASASASAKEVNALAYTFGNNIVFRNGEYQPQTSEGKKLLAHELTHVVQQSQNVAPKIQRVAGVDDAAEAVTIGAVLAWCLSGATMSVIIDEIMQLGKAASKSYNNGEWSFEQNWCRTIFSALFGCVFGMITPLTQVLLFEEITAFSFANLAKWVEEKLIAVGATYVAGRWGVAMAKLGCDKNFTPIDIESLKNS